MQNMPKQEWHHETALSLLEALQEHLFEPRVSCLLCAVVPQLPIDVLSRLYAALLEHREVLPTLLSAESPERKLQLCALLYFVCNTSPACIQPPLVPLLRAAYHATLDTSDRLLLKYNSLNGHPS